MLQKRSVRVFVKKEKVLVKYLTVFKPSLKNLGTQSKVIKILNFRDGPMITLVLSWVLAPRDSCLCYTFDPDDGGST
jgi:hypothetical protein